MSAACSCGSSEPHTIARRLTADGVRVEAWSDGAITGVFGRALPGLPIRRRAGTAAAWMFLGEVSLYEVSELPALYSACIWATARGLDVAAMRARLNADAPIQFAWTVTAADRDGKPAERLAMLNRIQWPGLAVLHTSRGYEVMSVVRRSAPGVRSGEVLVTTGFVFTSQRDLSAHLRSCSAVAS